MGDYVKWSEQLDKIRKPTKERDAEDQCHNGNPGGESCALSVRLIMVSRSQELEHGEWVVVYSEFRLKR